MDVQLFVEKCEAVCRTRTGRFASTDLCQVCPHDTGDVKDVQVRQKTSCKTVINVV